jgi:flagellar FliJ protein
MKKPNFRLKALLEYRRFLKTQAASRLAEAARERAHAYAMLMRVNNGLDKLEADLMEASRSAIRASVLMLLQSGLAHQRQQVEQARKAYAAALEKEQQCHQATMKLQQEYKSVLNLQEKQMDQYRADALREEELALNEYTTARFKQSVSC